MRHAVTVLAFISLLAPPAKADVITFIDGFSADSPAGLAEIHAFDPDLGTLDAVHVSILGSGFMTVMTGPVFSGPSPVPFSVMVGLDVDFDGFISQFFDFSDFATATATGVATGAGGPLVIPISLFSLSFTFDEFSDTFLGFDVPSASGIVPPPMVIGTRPAFVLSPTTLESVLLTQAGRIIATGGPASVLSSTLFGSIQVTYDFTPAPALPEPGLLSLLAIGASLAGWRRVTRPR